ncbi:MAG TPA: MFS transporter [Nocardioidaceae bacterium]|nr:MFS transporter [Actinomycetota bacterium]HEV8055982.1 MFS transporter [Nocardioidaceae bacterium]
MRRLAPRVANPFALLPREVAVLAAVALAVAIGFGVVAPAIPVFARQFGVGKTAAGAVISAFALMRFVSALAGGRLVDRFGERVILTTGILVVAVSTGLAGLSQSYEQLLVLRAVGGIGSAMFTVSAVALLFRVVASDSRGRATSLFQGGFLIGGLLGPLVGGALTEVSLRLPFFVYAVSLLVAGGIGAVFLAQARLREPPGDGDPASVAHTGIAEAFRHPAYRAALVANFGTGWALFGVRMSLIPLFVTEAVGVGAFWVGVGFLCSSVAQALTLIPAGRVVDQQGRRPALIAGGLVAGTAMLLLALTTALAVYVAAMLMFGVGAAFLGTAPAAVVGDVMHGRGGRVVAVFQMASDLGAIVGPLVAGALADTFSFGWGMGVTAGVLLAGVAVSARMPETRRTAV